MLPKFKVIVATLGALLIFLGLALLLPVLVGLLYGEPEWWAFAVTAGFSIVVGLGVRIGLRGGKRDLGLREGFAIVALSWFVLTCVGALPFVFAGVLDTYTDAFFETMSGFTTTGATIMGGTSTPDIEDLPHAFLIWRSFMQWLGGMGIIVLTLAILPMLGVGGMNLFRAETPGLSTDKLTPRIQGTARRLWFIYVGFTVVEVLLLLPAMSLFDSINHAFCTMATGGYSTKDGSIGQFGSTYVEWVVFIFMVLGGINFVLHYRMLRGDPISMWKDTEFRVYAVIVIAATLLITVGTWDESVAFLPWAGREAAEFQGYSTLMESIRHSAFQAVAIITSTGFTTTDYALWPPLGIGILSILYLCGGMAGSTAGGVKIIRHVLMFKNSFREIKQLIHPAAVIHVRLNGNVVPRNVLNNVLAFIVLYMGGIGVGAVVLFVGGLDLVTAFGASMQSIGNIGPAFGSVGPSGNYAHVPAFGKWFLSFMMMVGRLELFTVLILLAPAFWKR